MEKATELEYLRWFHANAFEQGPLGDALIVHLQREFVKDTGKEMPDAFTPDES